MAGYVKAPFVMGTSALFGSKYSLPSIWHSQMGIYNK